MDSNPTRARRERNRVAFCEILGDPFEGEQIDGMYHKLSRRSTVGAVNNNFEEGQATANPARPSSSDFFCDVERTIEEVITDKTMLKRFIITYIHGDVDSTEALPKSVCQELQQRIGKLFRAYKISPVSEYFKTVRKPIQG